VSVTLVQLHSFVTLYVHILGLQQTWVFQYKHVADYED